MFGPNIPALAKGRQGIGVDLQGHGCTADIDRPLNVALMADDIVALMKHLRIEQADLLGYSLGGGVALQVAFKHPALVRKLVVVSTPIRRDAFYPDILVQQVTHGLFRSDLSYSDKCFASAGKTFRFVAARITSSEPITPM